MRDSNSVNILLLPDYYLQWAGGANFFGYITKAILKASKLLNVNVHIACFNNDLNYNNKQYLSLDVKRINATGCFSTYLKESKYISEIIFFKDLRILVAEKNIALVGPTGFIYDGIEIPRLGYIPDFQHKYYPHLFSNNERERRDIMFRAIAEDLNGVYVNSNSVVHDLRSVYPGILGEKKVFILPGLVPNLEKSSLNYSVLEKFSITKNYFISCSQRWMHKQHDLIINAFANLVKRYPAMDMELIFTGETTDYRNPDYASYINRTIEATGLASRIKVLGLIDRSEQLHLIDNATCLIQASLFEGGAGASGMLEAAFLSTPIIASDIFPNLEFNYGQIHYFKKHNVEELTSLMCLIASNKFDLTFNQKNLPNLFFSNQVLSCVEISSGTQILNEFLHVIHCSKRG